MPSLFYAGQPDYIEKLNTLATAASMTNGTVAASFLSLAVTGTATAASFVGPLTGNASTATTLATARNINGVSFNGSADITVTAAAGTLTGATLAASVTASSLTSLGTLTALTVSGNSTLSGNVGIGGAPSQLLHLTSTDQSTLRIRLTNSGAGGRSWEVVGGLDGVNNSSFSIYDVTAAATRVNINSVGGFGFGIAAAADTSFYFGKDIDGATTAYGARFVQTINSAVVTTTGIGCISQNGTSGATTTVHQVRAEQGTFAGAVTNQMGFVAGSSLTGATNNYGFYSNIAAAANRYNFYAAGAAPNYFAGYVQCAGVVTVGSGSATIAGGSQANNITFGSSNQIGIYFGSGAPTVSAGKGSLYLRSDGSTTNDRMYVNTNGSTTWTAVTTVA